MNLDALSVCSDVSSQSEDEVMPVVPTRSAATKDFPAAKIDLYTLIIHQLEHDGFSNVANSLKSSTGLDTHPLADPDHLHDLYDSCLDILRDAPSKGLIASVPTPIPTKVAPPKFSMKWNSFISRCPVPPNLEEMSLDFEKPSKVLPLPGFTLLRQVNHNRGYCNGIAYSRDGHLVASTNSESGTIKLYNLPRIDARGPIPGVESEIISAGNVPASCLTFHGSQQLLFAAYMDGSLKLYDASSAGASSIARNNVVNTNTLSNAELVYHDDTFVAKSICMHPSNDYILTAGGSRLLSAPRDAHSPIRLIDVRSGRTFAANDRNGDHKGFVNALSYSSNGNFFISGGTDGVISLWEGSTMKRVNSLAKAHANLPITSLKILRAKHILLSAGLDGYARLWDLRMGKQLAAFECNTQNTNRIFKACSATTLHDERYVLLGAIPQEGKPATQLFNATNGHRMDVSGLLQDSYVIANSPVDNGISTGGGSGRCSIYDVSLGAPRLSAIL